MVRQVECRRYDELHMRKQKNAKAAIFVCYNVYGIMYSSEIILHKQFNRRLQDNDAD